MKLMTNTHVLIPGLSRMQQDGDRNLQPGGRRVC